MSFRVTQNEAGVVVTLTGWDRWLTLTRRVEVDLDEIDAVNVESRGGLESLIDSRVRGIGTNIGTIQPGRKRVGLMMGRAVAGQQQFWAVSPGAPEQPLVVIDTTNGAPFARLVVDVEDPAGFSQTLSERL